MNGKVVDEKSVQKGISVMNRFSEDRKSGCCFSGHRTLTPPDMEKAALRIAELLPGLVAEGITHFYAGGAIGFDLAASVTVINHKRTYPGIKLTLALPCRNHTNRWRRVDEELFRRVAARADEVVYVSEEYSRGCMQLRNRYMVNRSAICLCWLTSAKGGTFNTVSYAEKQGIKVVNLSSGYYGEQMELNFNGIMPGRFR